uniref:Ionotropic glutamate receptor C-terminal domain-containing protein n=1 Tax=Ciona savignyi TaxID=51511 RepID=H2YPT2_CIOSA
MTLNPPWLSWDIEDGLPVAGTYKGFLYDVISKLSDQMGFTFVIHNDTAVTFGEGFNHTDEMLEFEMNTLFEADICDIFLYDKTIYGGRLLLSDTVSITSSLMTSRLYFITERVEKNHDVSIWQFLAPFRNDSWLVLWTSLVAVCLLMTYINKNNPYEFKRASRDLPTGSKHSDHLGFLHSMWFNFASLVEQSSQMLPKSASLKILAGTWWCYVMLVVAAYTANMISFMTQVNSGGITTLTQLASQSEVRYGFIEGNPMLTKFLP